MKLHKIDPSLFVDVADAKNIESPAIPEKDYYVVQFLQLISGKTLPNHGIEFTGGTCLSKAHVDTHRMSEDVDLKLVPTEKSSKSSRKEVRDKFVGWIENSGLFKLNEEKIEDKHRKQTFTVAYPRQFSLDGLRPEIKLELFEGSHYQAPINRSICSMYAEIRGDAPEIERILCSPIETIACEKLIGFLRRVAKVEREDARNFDDVLMRHMYDISLIMVDGMTFERVEGVLPKIVEFDRNKFRNQKPFSDGPVPELRFALERLGKDPEYRLRYDTALLPLVYSRSLDWNKDFSEFRRFADHALSLLEQE